MCFNRMLNLENRGFCYALAILFMVHIFPVYGQVDGDPSLLETFQYEEDIVYKSVDGKALTMVLIKPENMNPGKKIPWMLYIHGGGWRAGSLYKITTKPFLGTLRQITENGIACVAINYRLTRGETTAYDCVVDCKDATRFLVKNAEKYGLDPDRYGVWGGSAGGHLSLMTALGNNEDFIGDPALAVVTPHFKCVASYYPLTTLVNSDVLEGSVFEDTSRLHHVLDGSAVDKPGLARLLSPTEYLTENSPPILLLHGENDQVLSLKNSLYMLEIAENNRADVKLLIVENADHVFTGENISPSMEKINEISASFIISHLQPIDIGNNEI